jgi:hypothetical protein
LPDFKFSTLSVVRSSRYAISLPSGEKPGWKASDVPSTTGVSLNPVALKKLGSALSVRSVR